VNTDRITLHDLSFLEGEHSVFALLNRCSTQAGTEVLRQMMLQPPANFALLSEHQSAVRFWMNHSGKWTDKISNGTLVMIRKFYESADTAHENPGALSLMVSTIIQKWFNKNAYSFIRFSLSHIVDFLTGCDEMINLLRLEPPLVVRELLESMKSTLELPLCKSLLSTKTDAPQRALLSLSYRARREIKSVMYKMMSAYARLDAFQAMGTASRELGWTMPELLPSDALRYEAKQLFHPLLDKPVAYDLSFSEDQNFLFLTGANMSGKSTLIRALGIGALLAHTGMGVPAASMRISFLEGIITNMQVADNIFLGESYFFAEVQRMKLTAEKLSKSRFHLVLMDELFKGTNVHDAYECSLAVIEGLLQQTQNLMALSTHLNELSESLHDSPKVFFRYCNTNISAADTYTFTYELKEGVSRDRVGYLVLKKEGVLDLLNKKQGG
jgi:DNA mismatch repair ATPase MutS